jgi:hypothetical protein
MTNGVESRKTWPADSEQYLRARGWHIERRAGHGDLDLV